MTAGRPCYDKSRGLSINEDQSIAAFFSKVFPNPVQANLSAKAISISQGGDTDLVISFMRTVRIPEDQHDYDLPPGLGKFPLYDVQAFSNNLPVSMAAQGGIFFCMYRKLPPF